MGEMTTTATKTHMRLKTMVADIDDLTEIKAELRARSELRPADDGELLPVFERLIKEVAPPTLAIDVAVPAASEPTGVPPPSASAAASGAVAAPTSAGAVAASAAP